MAGGLFAATLLMIFFRQRYPRWWFDFALQLSRFSARVGLPGPAHRPVPLDRGRTAIHLDIDYPDAQKDLNRWLPLVKWFLAIPHIVVLAFLGLGAVVAVVVAWFAILFTGRYPRALFDYVVGVGRWALRVQAYAMLLGHRRVPALHLPVKHLGTYANWTGGGPWSWDVTDYERCHPRCVPLSSRSEPLMSDSAPGRCGT